MRRCPTCLTKIQEFHKKIYNICERPESGIVTVYKTTESGQTQHNGRFKDLYSGYPINVELANRKDSISIEKNYSSINFTAALKRKILNTNLKSAAKAGFVAAIMVAAFILSLNTSPAEGTSFAQIFSNVEHHNNVYISQFSSGKTEPSQEQWISGSSNFKISKTKNMLVLFDIANNKKITKSIGSNLQESTPLTYKQTIDLEYTIKEALELTSFQDMKNLPPNAEWKHITDQSRTDNTDEYVLIWEEKGYNISIYNKLKIFTDAKTELPLTIESYRKLSENNEYELRTRLILKYLSDDEISAVKDNCF